MLILDLIHNIALLVALAATYRVLLARFSVSALRYRVIIGLLFGGVALVGMMTPIELRPGVIYDGRSIILATAGLFGGPVVVVIAALITAAYRVYLGGAGMWAGLGVIAMSAAAGTAYFELRRRGILRVTPLILWLFGLLVHVLMLAIQQILPNQAGLVVLRELGLPILLTFPLATMLIGLLFWDSENQIRDRKALAESERALVKAQQVAHVGSWVWDIQKNELTWSVEMYHIFGIDPETFTGNLSDVISSAIHPDDRARVEEANRLVAEHGKPSPLEYRVLHPDGSVRVIWGEAGELAVDKHGQPAVLTGIVQDITERREAEMELRESEKRYRNLILHSPDAIFVNHNDRVVLANEACLKLFGAQEESDLLGKSPFDLFHPDFHPQIRARIDQMLSLGQPVPAAEEQIVRLDGSPVLVEVVAAPFTFRGASDIHVILRDITARKQMEQDLIQSHAMLRGLAEQVPGVIYTYKLDPDGKSRFPYASPGMWEIYEVKPEEVREDATVVFGRLHPEDIERVSKLIYESARTLELFYCEFRVILPQQGLRWRVSRARPERTPDGGTLWYGTISDTTERMLAEQKITEQLEELRRWRSVMIGREARTIELKQEVNALLQKAGLPARYSVDGAEPHPANGGSAGQGGVQ